MPKRPHTGHSHDEPRLRSARRQECRRSSSHRHETATLTVPQAVERARAAGLRRTKALEDVLRMLIAAHRPLTLADLAESKELASGADRATVYRLLMKLEERGLIRRLGLHDRSAYYTIIQPGEHHDYLICTKCGAIEKLDISCPVEALENEIEKQSGFKKLYHELEFFGLCPRCG